MGGFGSGNPLHFGGRPTTETCPSLDVRMMAKLGVLGNGQTLTMSVSSRTRKIAEISILYRHDRLHFAPDYQPGYSGKLLPLRDVDIVWTPCNYGNRRPWFVCPRTGCGRRAAVLYWRSGFACRVCHGLAYESQRESQIDRLARRIQKLNHRLAGRNGSGSINARPKGMHERTFERLHQNMDMLDRFVEIAFAARQRTEP